MKKILTTASLLSLAVCQTAFSAPVENFGTNLAPLQQAFANKNVHILQIGDSHTAGDYFTDQLRKRLQADVGDGGVGFAYPINVKAQRTARHGYQADGFSTFNSKSDTSGDYVLGGITAVPNSSFSTLNLTSQYYNGDRQNAKVVVRGNAGQKVNVSDINGSRQLTLNQNGWQTVDTTINFPARFNVDSNMAMGGFWLGRGQGGRVSAMGINGATQSYWQRWQKIPQTLNYSGANLVILAYGTNEAFQSDVSGQMAQVNQAIAQIKQGLPNASILIVNAPESLKNTSGSCGTRATSLDTVQYQLRQIAQQNGTLYWSWQDAMGGECSMKSWIAEGLGAKDGVHFSKSGYERAGNDLYDGLKMVLQASNTSSTFRPVTPISSSVNGNVVNISNYQPTATASAPQKSIGVIGGADGKCTSLKH